MHGGSIPVLMEAWLLPLTNLIRGYYYDTESRLYYLNSRYYDPEISRFLNADAILIGMAFRGLNLFIVSKI